jgi:hypothetical protein
MYEEEEEEEETREMRAEVCNLRDAWLIEKEELTQEVLSNRGFDWTSECLTIECQIHERMIDIAPLVNNARLHPAFLTQPTPFQKRRAKILRKQLQTIVFMGMRRQLILSLIGAEV